MLFQVWHSSLHKSTLPSWERRWACLSISIKNNTSSQNQFLFYDSTVKLLLYPGCQVNMKKERSSAISSRTKGVQWVFCRLIFIQMFREIIAQTITLYTIITNESTFSTNIRNDKQLQPLSCYTHFIRINSTVQCSATKLRHETRAAN